MISDTFKALSKEAALTKEMLGSGATQIRRANYASKGVYFQAFTSLSTGLERIGKLCLMLDHYIEHPGKFPDSSYIKDEIRHNILVIYRKSASVITKRSICMRFLQNLNDPIHQGILSVLCEFAQGDRYSNINLLVGGKRQSDPIASWFERVDKPLYETRVAPRKKQNIQWDAVGVGAMLRDCATALHTSETGRVVMEIEEASYMTGMYHAVAPHRQLYVLQIIRYWVELLTSLQYLTMAVQAGREDIPFFTEVFGAFYNDDSHIRTRKTWDSV